MSGSGRLTGSLRRCLRDLHAVYRDAAASIVDDHPSLLPQSPSQFVRRLDDLHRGLAVKVYVETVRADRRWTGPEKRVAAALIEHLWRAKLTGDDLRQAATKLFADADVLRWSDLVQPFSVLPPLHDRRPKVEAAARGLAELIAECDGELDATEQQMIDRIGDALNDALYPDATRPSGADGPDRPSDAAANHGSVGVADGSRPTADATSEDDRRSKLDGALKELDALVGLNEVKRHVRSYTNFLRLQSARKASGRPTMPLTLHLVFTGNPGTGKTTVARIVGHILAAMGTLSKGHVVETDRNGLVAGYMGQTATKTNDLCDRARGGVLFIDEAYGLIAKDGEDSYGREALATLIKRMEDDRGDLAVILAGYRDEMASMIRTNPGLSSRIGQTIDFEDYDGPALSRIFDAMCRTHQYQLTSEARHRILIGMDRLHAERDRHFGNGRLVRNAFEATVRAMADRIADGSSIAGGSSDANENLETLTGRDVVVPGVTPETLGDWLASPHRLLIRCDGCRSKISVRPKHLAGGVGCPKCGTAAGVVWPNVHWQPEARGSDESG